MRKLSLLLLVLFVSSVANAAIIDKKFLPCNVANGVSCLNGSILIDASVVPTLNQSTSGTAANLSGTPALPNGTTATTQTAADNSTKLATTAYVDTAVGALPAAKTWYKQQITLSSGDITAQYVDASQDCVLNSVALNVTGVWGVPTDDYTLSTVASKARITFVASTGWGTGSSQALVAGDKINLMCQY